MAIAPSEPSNEPKNNLERLTLAVRVERWEEVASLLDALPEAERRKPELRYLRARAAMSLGHPEEVGALIEALEEQLPLLRHEIEELRGRLALAIGPRELALRAWARGEHQGPWVRGAKWFEGAPQPEVEGILRQLVGDAKPVTATRLEVQARALRFMAPWARAEERSRDKAWLLDRPSMTAGALSAEGVQALGRGLAAGDRLELVLGLAERGEADAALAQLEELEAAKGVVPGRFVEVRGRVLRAARRHREAAEVLERAAKLNPARGAELRLLAARSWWRVGQLDRARTLLSSLSTKGSEVRSRATLALARLQEQAGRRAEALRLYEQGLGRGGALSRASSERNDALAGLALLLLTEPEGGAPARRARALLEGLGREAGPEEAARWRELEGVAAWRAGARDDAEALWRAVAEQRPLTFAGQLSRLRLQNVGASVPPLWAGVAEAMDARPPSSSGTLLPARAALLHALGLEAEAERALMAEERSWSSVRAGAAGWARCLTYGQLGVARERYRAGVREVEGALLWKAPTGTSRWAWECLYPRPYGAEVEAQERLRGLPSGLLYAVMRQESAFDPRALSPVRAQGLMQLMPATASRAASELGWPEAPLELSRPSLSLPLSAFYLAKLRGLFGGSLPMAIAAYNAGPEVVADWRDLAADGPGRELDLWAARIPFAETRSYVSRVLGNLARYQYLAGGESAVEPWELLLPGCDPKAREAY
jgi:soluble lytic murein transglycosylase